MAAGSGPGLTPVKLGQKGSLSTQGGGEVGFGTVNYIIALQGTFPSRN